MERIEGVGEGESEGRWIGLGRSGRRRECDVEGIGEGDVARMGE